MLRGVRGLLVGLAVLSTASAVAVARTVPTTGGAPETTHYRGSDAAGQVTFKVHDLYAGNGPVYVYGFSFANSCSTSATMVKAHMSANGTFHFHYAANGITVAGQLHRKLVTSGSEVLVKFSNAGGTVRVHTATCDSGVLRFTAKEGKTT
jgi:hypothetical protein